MILPAYSIFILYNVTLSAIQDSVRVGVLQFSSLTRVSWGCVATCCQK